MGSPQANEFQLPTPDDLLKGVNDFYQAPVVRAQSAAVADLNEDPDSAAKSIQFGQEDGLPPSVVHADPTYAERKNSRQVSDLIANNPELQAYINKNSMASKVSNDDWHNLQIAHDRTAPLILTPWADIWEGMKQGFWQRGNTFGLDLKGTEKWPIEVQTAIKNIANPIAAWIDIGFQRTLDAALGGVQAGAKSVALRSGLASNEAWADRFARDAGIFAQGFLIEPAMAPHVDKAANQLAKDAKFFQTLKPYKDSGETPPLGVHPAIDEIHSALAEQDAKNLDEALKAAQASKTRERSPEMFAAALREKTQGAEVGISADVVRELYGEKRPEAGDGILGWIPDLDKQLESTEGLGGDVRVPLSDWLAFVEPEVAKKLHDDLRVGKGYTLREIEASKDHWESQQEQVDLAQKPAGKQALSFETVKQELERRGWQLNREGNEAGQPFARYVSPDKKTHIDLYHYKENFLVSVPGPEQGIIVHDKTSMMRRLRRDLTKLDGQKSKEWESFREKRAAELAPNLAVPEGSALEDQARKEAGIVDLGQMKEIAPGIRMGVASRAELDEMRAEPANDLVAREKKPSYDETVNDQQIQRIIKEGAVVRPYEAWERIAKEEGHELYGQPNGFKAAKEQSKDGRARVVVDQEGRRSVYLDGKKILRDRFVLPDDLAQRRQLSVRFKGASADGYHQFDIHDEAGNKIGYVSLGTDNLTKPFGHKDKGLLYIENIEAGKPAEGRSSRTAEPQGTPNAFGFNATMRMLYDVVKNYPDAERIGGIRVTGARMKAGVEDFKKLWWELSVDKIRAYVERGEGKEDLAQFAREFGWDLVAEGDRGNFQPIAPWETQGFGRPTDDVLSEHERNLIKAVNDIADKMAPQAKVRVYKELTIGDRPAQGAFSFNHFKSIIGIALDAEDIHATTKHELIHYLRRGFLTDREWSVLEETAKREDWSAKYDIDERYGDIGEDLRLEESIAEEFSEWYKNDEPPHVAGGAFEKILRFLMEVKRAVTDWYKDQFGVEPKTADEVFRAVEGGKVGAREQSFRKAQGGAELAQRPDLWERGSALGMTEQQFKRYTRLIEKQNAEAEASQIKKISGDISKRQSAEWKAKEATVREEMRDEVLQRPDIVALSTLRENGMKFDPQWLTPEQKQNLPKDLVGKGGLRPDDIAGFFGYQTGEAMLNRLDLLDSALKHNKLDMAGYVDAVTDGLTEKAMQQRFGRLDENIMAEARENIITATQMDLLHEELMALSAKTGLTPQFTRADLKAAIGLKFEGTGVTSARDPSRWIEAAGKNGRAAEDALLKGDATEAFRLKQVQFNNLLMYQESKRFAKEMGRAERVFKRLHDNKTFAGMDQDYVDQLHRVMDQIGVGSRRDPRELADALAKHPVEDFWLSKYSEGRELMLADFLVDPAWQKDVNRMTVGEFRDVADTVTSFMTNAREERVIELKGRKVELEAVAAEVKANTDQIKQRFLPRDPGKIENLKSGVYSFDAMLLKMEQLIDWLDRGDPNGPLNRMFRRLSDAKHVEGDLRKILGTQLRALPKLKDLGKTIQHQPMEDWHTGAAMTLTRKDMLGIMLNMGTESNLKKLTAEFQYEGGTYQMFTPAEAELIVRANATKEDWAWVKQVWATFDQFWPDISNLSRRMSGIAPDKVRGRIIDTPFGPVEGGYYPLIADDRWIGPGAGKDRGIFGEDRYTRAVPPRGYTKARTGAAYPLELSPDFAVSKLSQTIHDLAYREALVDAKKLFSNLEVRRAIQRAFGPEYLGQVNPWLEHMANPYAANMIDNSMIAGLNNFARQVRQRVVAVQLMFRASTVVKHGAAALFDSFGELGKPGEMGNYLKEMAYFYGQPWKSKDRIAWALEKSGELRNRIHDTDRDIGEMLDKNLGKNGLYASMLHWGSLGVGTIDMGSAIPTWSWAYKKALREGANEADAVYAGDKAVRAAHGATGAPDLPAIMRSSEVAKTFTIAYGFFNHNYNRVRSIARLAKEGAGDLADGEFRNGFTKFQRAAWMSMWYVVFMGVLEESVSPALNQDKESWGGYLAHGMIHQLASTIPVLREIIGSALGHGGSASPMVEMGKSLMAPFQDMKRYEDGGKTSDIVKHSITALGYAVPIPGAGQAAMTSQFLWDLVHRRQRAETPGKLIRGLAFGKSHPERRTPP